MAGTDETARAAPTDDSSLRLPATRDPVFHLYALHIWTIFGLALSNFLLGLAVLATPTVWSRGQIAWRRNLDLLRPLLFYVVLLLASTLLSFDPRHSLGEAGELLSLAALPLGLLLVDSERRARWIVNGLVIVAAGVALYGLAQLLTGYGVTHRIRGPFSIYMTFAGVLMLADLLLIAQMVYREGWRSRWRWAAFILINLALLGSLTRSAWVGLGLALFVLLIMRAPRYVPAFLAVVVALILLAPGALGERIRSISDLRHPANYDRICMLDSGLHMIEERPLFGIGPGSVKELYPLYRHPTAVLQTLSHLHNNYLHIAAERGLLSLAAYLWLVGASLWVAFRGARDEIRRNGGRRDLYVGALGGLLAFHLAGLFEYNWGDTEVQRIALFLVVLPFALRGLPHDDPPA
jgi:O-antigen ligase